MKRDIKSLIEKEYDLLIIGGGFFGASALWEAASRGLSAVLVDKGDFCHATSANHLKMIHGGIRYLQHADIVRIRESSHERSAFLRIAPHLVRPLPVVIPTYGHGIKGKEALRAGFFIYNFATFDRNKYIKDTTRHIPYGKFISRKEILKQYPALETKGLTGGAIFYDGQMYNPPRLVLSFIRSAVMAGANAANYVEVNKLLRNNSRIIGAGVKDVLTGEQFEIRSKIVLNASGGWSNRLLEHTLGFQIKPKPVYSRDLAFIVNKPLAKKYGLATPLKTKDADALIDRGGRHLFVAPWRGNTLIGVWHKVFNKPPEELSVTEDELKGFINEVNDAYGGFDLTLKDISMVLTGLTLFGEESKQEAKNISFGKRSRIIDHFKENKIEGLVTLLGVRATTARGMAEKTVDLIFSKLSKRIKKSMTCMTPIYGGNINIFEDYYGRAIKEDTFNIDSQTMQALIHNYGSQYKEVTKYLTENPSWAETLGNSTVLKGEIIHAIRDEMASKLADVVLRRTDLGTSGDPGDKALKDCAEIMKNELSWNDGKVLDEIEEVSNFFEKRGFINKPL